MALLTLYKPDGEVIEYDGINGIKNSSGVLIFESHPDSSTPGYKRILTTLPYLYEEQLP